MGRRQFGEPKSFFFSVVWYRTARLCPPTLPSPHTPLQESVGPRQNQNWAEPLWQSQKHMMRCGFLAFGSNKAWWFMTELRLGIMSTLQVTSKADGWGVRAEDSRPERCFLEAWLWARFIEGLLGAITQWCLLLLSWCLMSLTSLKKAWETKPSLDDTSVPPCFFSLPLCPFVLHCHPTLQSWPETNDRIKKKKKDEEKVGC